MTSHIVESDSGSSGIDVTVILTAHAEGRLAHRSVRSAHRAIRFARQQGIQAELIAVLDSASRETRAYFENHKHLFRAVSEVDLRDLGLSRNHGVKLALGRYIAFLDADDLFSQNWLAAAVQFAKTNGDETSVLHPAISVFFGARSFYWTHISSTDAVFSPFDLIVANYWTALCFVARDWFLNGNWYAPTNLKQGFGLEDWHWNCEVMANGGSHLVVPSTAQFIRLKTENSLHTQAKSLGAVFRQTKLFDQASTHPLFSDGLNSTSAVAAAGESESSGYRLPKIAYRGVKQLARNTLFKDVRAREFYAAILNAARVAVATPTQASSLPRWLIDEWRLIHQIEPELFPTEQITRDIDRYDPVGSLAGRLYPALDALVGSSSTHVFLVPTIKPDGSNLEAIQQMTAVAQEDVGSRVVCIATESTDPPRQVQLPEDVTFVAFGQLTISLTEEEKAVLLARLLIQKSPAVIHNIQSSLGHHLFRKYGRALSAQSRLFTSSPGAGAPPDNNYEDFPSAELPHYIDHLTKVFSDNQHLVERLCDIYAFERERFAVTYLPVTPNPEIFNRKPDDGCLRVVWAGRMGRRKRPDVLVRVATKLTGLPVHFHVYGEPQPDPIENVNLQELRSMTNVTTYGYKEFRDIEAGKYDLFLYTSRSDGLPYILLEAAAAGLPIVAPDVGGIKEFINEKTGFLVSHTEAVDEYVTCIESILSDRLIVMPKIAAARALLETRHSWASFVDGLRKVPGYFIESYARDPALLDEASALP